MENDFDILKTYGIDCNLLKCSYLSGDFYTDNMLSSSTSFTAPLFKNSPITRTIISNERNEKDIYLNYNNGPLIIKGDVITDFLANLHISAPLVGSAL